MLIKIGVITKPQGLRGEFRVKILEPNYFEELNTVVIDTERKVEKLSSRPKFVVLKVEGIDSCEEAETLRGLDVKAEKVKARALKKGEFKIADLIGKHIKNNKGKDLGELILIENFGSADIFNIKTKDGKEFSFPFIDGIVQSVDESIIVDEKKLEEVRID